MAPFRETSPKGETNLGVGCDAVKQKERKPVFLLLSVASPLPGYATSPRPDGNSRYGSKRLNNEDLHPHISSPSPYRHTDRSMSIRQKYHWSMSTANHRLEEIPGCCQTFATYVIPPLPPTQSNALKAQQEGVPSEELHNPNRHKRTRIPEGKGIRQNRQLSAVLSAIFDSIVFNNQITIHCNPSGLHCVACPNENPSHGCPRRDVGELSRRVVVQPPRTMRAKEQPAHITRYHRSVFTSPNHLGGPSNQYLDGTTSCKHPQSSKVYRHNHGH
ncbi:hypothetical protein WH47_05339 [Habropoda laboriosa]|uniref:Uncharacterized protein n=1 Tax=Habropoda laboriosa TaxID=597456 RepID=A0A0L7QTD5_9HYME|nr:hypothetical protein WH47_05339 [Habropoda laboriosa]